MFSSVFSGACQANVVLYFFLFFSLCFPLSIATKRGISDTAAAAGSA